MKRAKFLHLAGLSALAAACSGKNSNPIASDTTDEAALSTAAKETVTPDYDNYALILQDSDTWLIELNKTLNRSYFIRYKGVLRYGYGSATYTGEAKAVYYKSYNYLLITCIDPGWNNFTLAYSFHIQSTTSNKGLFLYNETGISNIISGNLLKSDLPGFEVAKSVSKTAIVQQVSSVHPKRARMESMEADD